MKTLTQIILSFLLFGFINLAAYGATENVFYVLRDNTTLDTIKNHANSIQILISQAYRVDANGTIKGQVNPELLALANAQHIKVMAMITNTLYDEAKVHRFLKSKTAQEKVIQAILSACKKDSLYGVQFDFEGVSVNDKNALTAFYQKAADKLHHAGFKVSYAVIPAFQNQMNASVFLRKAYKNWSGVYDLKALAKSADFITIMAYNQHPGGTIPGPNASIEFTEAAIQNALKNIPAEKLSLGIPSYSLYWFSGYKTLGLQQHEIDFANACKLIKDHHADLIWNNKDKVNYAIYEHNWLDEYVYLEDVDSFQAKLNLVKKYHLRGFSLFRIGTEDTRVWAKINNSHLA